MDKSGEFKKVESDLMAFTDSPLYAYRVEHGYLPVPGEGSLEAKIIFIGEAPGEKEAKTGKPFCGRAGKILDSILGKTGIDRKEVFITSIVKDRPPANRDPLQEEIDAYAPFMDRQIEILKPKVIATLGRFSMEYIMNKYGLSENLDSIGNLHGKVFETVAPWGKVKVIPHYHPAAAIYNQKLLKTLEEDFIKLRNI